MSWFARIVAAVVYGVIAYLACVLSGAILVALAGLLPAVGVVLAIVGHFLETWAGAIAVLVFFYVLFIGYEKVPWRR